MEKTAMQDLIEYINEGHDITFIAIKAARLLELEKNQMCKMYIQGRKDEHLDYYPEKHAKETYDEFFNNKEGKK